MRISDWSSDVCSSDLLFEHRRLDRAALFVEPIQLLRDLRRLLRIAGSEQPHAEVRLADAPAGVDPRAERKTHVTRARRLGEPRGTHQQSGSASGWERGCTYG